MVLPPSSRASILICMMCDFTNEQNAGRGWCSPPHPTGSVLVLHSDCPLLGCFAHSRRRRGGAYVWKDYPKKAPAGDTETGLELTGWHPLRCWRCRNPFPAGAAYFTHTRRMDFGRFLERDLHHADGSGHILGLHQWSVRRPIDSCRSIFGWHKNGLVFCQARKT